MPDQTTISVSSTWQGGMKFFAADGLGHTVTSDAPSEDGVPFDGFKPPALLLAALAGCAGVDVAAISLKQRQAVTGLEINVTGKQAPEAPWVYEEIHMEYILRGSGLNEKSISRAIELSETRYCSVAASLNKDCKLTNSYRIIEEASG